MLNLTPSQERDYAEIYARLANLRDCAPSPEDAKYYRQKISALYHEYKAKEIPPDPTYKEYNCECPNCGYTLTIT